MTPKGAYFANIAGVCAAMAVSFVVSAILLKTSKVKEEDDIEDWGSVRGRLDRD